MGALTRGLAFVVCLVSLVACAGTDAATSSRHAGEGEPGREVDPARDPERPSDLERPSEPEREVDRESEAGETREEALASSLCPTVQAPPAFDRGDPCEAARGDCAWSTTRGRCVPFTPLTQCPSTIEGARAADVLCDHSGQPPLVCDYGQTRCACVRSTYCGGAPPPPWLEHPPGRFVCVPPFDEQGCPTAPIREGTRCQVDPAVQCLTCTTLSRCQGGRWRIFELPPRP